MIGSENIQSHSREIKKDLFFVLPSRFLVRERAFDYVVTVTAPLSGGYVRTQIMIMMQNYDVSNHYSEIES